MKKTLMIMGGILVGLVMMIVIVFSFVSMTSNKLVCKSPEASITILYNEKNVTGYTTKNMSYDKEGQNKYAEQIGITAYIEEFSMWFKNNTTGSCEKK